LGLRGGGDIPKLEQVGTLRGGEEVLEVDYEGRFGNEGDFVRGVLADVGIAC
jgi:hypothetical protein